MNHSPTEWPQGSANSKTPQTDAKCRDYSGPLCSIGSVQFIPADFARRLEREISEWRSAFGARGGETVKQCRDIWQHALYEQDDLRRQLSQSEERVAKLEGVLNLAKSRLEEIDHKSEGRWNSAYTVAQIDALLLQNKLRT